ncbi:MAG: CoA synthetase [Betaproteobacteria bacterium]|nr:CoA synthetase [Betaproteobacteria bacterium]MDH5219813.1 CoA synthetase [Betaproteobacteria bacterium]MDH5350576.1 CoA synthetase [Betaproteobacteria bacterium]
MSALASNTTRFLADADALAREIADGASIGLPPDYSLVAMDVVRALVRRKAKDLKLIGVPQLGLCADLLIGAGCVREIETSAVTLGEAGLAPRFTAAAETKSLRIIDATCPMVHSGLQATEKGVPFMPMRGVLGSDLVGRHPDWKTIDNPFAEGDPLLLAKAIVPDVALFHARWADEAGNVWVGRRKELATIAHASKACYVTYEELYKGDMLEDELLAPGCISSVYVSAVAPAPRGAWPLGVPLVYGIDDAHLLRYAQMAKSDAGFRQYLQEFVWNATTPKSSSPASSRA